jgi:hypothetical protein
MRTRARPVLLILLLAAMTAQPMLAFEYPLSSEAIREAYFLGRGNPDKKNAFFEKYRHNLPVPESGPHVSLIEVETPFACLVDEINSGSPNDHAQEAERKYLGKPGHFRVHVDIYFTPSYPGPAFNDIAPVGVWEDFKVHLKQEAEIEPQSIHGQLIYSYDDSDQGGIVGATIETDYEVEKIDSGSITTVEVDTPAGQNVETAFPLNGLR